VCASVGHQLLGVLCFADAVVSLDDCLLLIPSLDRLKSFWT
jgi:hypothetical protein